MCKLDTLQYDAITVFFPSRDTTQPNSLVSLKPYFIRHLIMLRKYIHHLVQDSHLSVSSDATDYALEPDNFLHTTFHQFMSWKLNEITTSSPSPPTSVTPSDPRAAPSTPSCSSQLLNYKRGIKRDISAYPTLEDEKYYESFKRSVLVTARANVCEEILQPTFRPRRDADSLELFRLKNDFMYSVFNKCLLSDMGKTIVRKRLDNMNAQRVWEEFSTHMTTSSKGKAEKSRFHTYVTTTVLDKNWKGTTEQLILHFNEQFRQLYEVSPSEESPPYTTKLTLLQNAVHNIPELRMVETMEEFISHSCSTPGPSMGYDNYLTLLQNSCIRYDSNLKSRPSPASRAAYQHELSHDQHDNPYPQDYSSTGTTYGGIDMPEEKFYKVHTTNLIMSPNVSTITPRTPTTAPPTGRPTPRRSPGPIFLPANIYKLLSDVAIKELKKHNATTRSTPPPKRAVNTHDTDPHPEIQSSDTPTGDPTPPDSHAEPDLDNAEPCEAFTFDDSTLEHIMDTYSPSYSINKTNFYHVSKHSSSHYGSLIDRGANGGLAGSDVRILERTGRTVSVTGIDNHELPGLDIVTCAALLYTNHGKVVLIMHEYAYYGRGNTIHSPGQIEWFQNTCDDKSFHVGGKQVITFLDGYSTPLQCRTGLMYMSLLGKPPDADLNTYPHVLLTGPHEWDTSVLDYTPLPNLVTPSGLQIPPNAVHMTPG